MKKVIVVAGSLLLFCVGWVFGQQNASNGTLWKSMDRSTRIIYVKGFTDGACGWNEGRHAKSFQRD